MVSTMMKVMKMRAEDDRWPLKIPIKKQITIISFISLSLSRKRLDRDGAAACLVNQTRPLRVGCRTANRLVEVTGSRRPCCRTQTGHARSIFLAVITGRGFDSPRVHHLIDTIEGYLQSDQVNILMPCAADGSA